MNPYKPKFPSDVQCSFPFGFSTVITPNPYSLLSYSGNVCKPLFLISPQARRDYYIFVSWYRAILGICVFLSWWEVGTQWAGDD